VIFEALAAERAWDPELRPRYERLAREAEPEPFPPEALAAALEAEFARAYDAAAAGGAEDPLAAALEQGAGGPGGGEARGWAAAATARLSHAALAGAMRAAMISARPEAAEFRVLDRELRAAYALAAGAAAGRVRRAVAKALPPGSGGGGAPPAKARARDLASFRRAVRAVVEAGPVACAPRGLHLFALQGGVL
jgi:hypothetical protein